MLKNGNMDPINIPEMLAYVPAPWIRHGIQMKGLGVRFTPTQTFRHLEDLGRLKHHKRASFSWFLIRTQLGSRIIGYQLQLSPCLSVITGYFSGMKYIL